MNTVDPMVFLSDAMADLSRQQNNIILQQLGDLVKAGLLVVTQEQPMIVQEPGPQHGTTRLVLRQKIGFVLKDQEYIDALKKENAELKALLQKVRDVHDLIQGL